MLSFLVALALISYLVHYWQWHVVAQFVVMAIVLFVANLAYKVLTPKHCKTKEHTYIAFLALLFFYKFASNDVFLIALFTYLAFLSYMLSKTKKPCAEHVAVETIVHLVLALVVFYVMKDVGFGYQR